MKMHREKARGGTYRKFDERQIQIRSRVFARAWVLTIILLFACATAGDAFNNYMWAPPWQTYMIIAAVSFTYGGIELLLRDAYFEKNGATGWGIPYMIAILSLIAAVWRVIDFIRGEKFASGGALTEEGGFFVLALLLLAFGAVGVVKSRQLRNHTDEPDEA